MPPSSVATPLHRRVNVGLGERSYPIYIGPSLLDDANLLRRHLAGTEVFLFSNDRVGPLYQRKILDSLAPLGITEYIMPDGESHKTFATLNCAFDALLAARHSRRTTILALGGGVVGDIAGFAAACYQRGVAFIQIPTTLLAQVDSSVGGKTAINHALGKNMIGAFHQPRAVISDISVLATLPERELKAGLAEIIKYGVMWDAEFFSWIEANLTALISRDETALTYAVTRSCEIKAEVVGLDETETKDIRALLNYGHTFGHAIENLVGYGHWLHGEAVGAGMVLAADLACRMNWIEFSVAGRIKSLIAGAGLPTSPPPNLGDNEFLKAMGLDKKVIAGQMRFILPRAIGQCVVTDAVPPTLLRQTLTAGAALCENP